MASCQELFLAIEQNDRSNADSEEDIDSNWMPSDTEENQESEVRETNSPPVVCNVAVLDPVNLTDDNNTEELTTKRKRSRTPQPENWVANRRRRSRNAGKEYKTATGKIVAEKRVRDIQCNCTKKCNAKIPYEHRQALFTQFISLTSWESQNAFVVGSVGVTSVGRRDQRGRRERNPPSAANAPRQKNQTRVYVLKNITGTDIQVCKPFYLETLQISNGRLDRALGKQARGEPAADQRGRHDPGVKTSVLAFNHVKAFINKIPVYESHYSRARTVNRKYFGPGLTQTLLYELYKEKCVEDSVTPVSDWKFRDIFKKEFNISFHAPLSDTCKTCDSLKVKIAAAETSNNANEITVNKTAKELHLRKAEASKTSYNEDVKLATSSNNITTLCFDLQRTLPTPVLTTSVVFYKRQLWVYNLGIHEHSGEGFMYMWDESKGSRGPDEIASCLHKHIVTQPPKEHIIAYADTCGGQNRNIKMSLFWMRIVENPAYSVKLVDQKYFVSGHSYMDCDRDFGIIEKAKAQNTTIYVPKDWVALVKGAKKKPKPFIVTEMAKEDLITTKLLEKAIVNRKVDMDGEKVEWLKIQWLQFRHDEPKKIFFKTTCSREAPFRCVDLSRVGGNVRQRQLQVGQQSMPMLNPNGRKIALPKLNDLITLLDYVPPIHHPFYLGLQGDNNAQDGGLLEEGEEDV